MKKLAPFLFLILVILGVYSPAIGNGFVWDDAALVLRDPLIRSWRLIPEGFNHFLFTDATASDFYRPLQRLGYTLEYAAFGFTAAAYHATSIAWHAAAALALFLFSRELLGYLGVTEAIRRGVAFVATIAWAVHPLHTSAVAYISGRADPLAAAFGFLALYLGLRSSRAEGMRAWAFTAGSAISFLLSSLSKESGLVFLAGWLALLLTQRSWRMAGRAAVLALFVVITHLSLRLPAEHIPPPAPSSRAPLLVKPIIVARAFAEYTGLIVLPVNLRMERDVETQTIGLAEARLTGAAQRELQTLAGLALIAAFIYWLLRERRRDRPVFVCLLLSLIFYVPVSGLFQLNATIAEHWLYAPTAFLFLGAALLIARLLRTSQPPVRRRFVIAAAALWIACLGGRTFVRTFDWKDQRTFLARTMASGGNSARMLINLGALELNEGRLDEAKKHLQEALRREPGQPLAVINLAAVALKEDDFTTARDLLTRATQMPLVEAQAHELLAVLEHKEKGGANLLRMRLASRSGPPNWQIEKRYIKLLNEAGATEAAINEARHCLGTQWYRAETWQLLSELLMPTGRKTEAATAMHRAHLYDVRLAERRAAR